MNCDWCGEPITEDRKGIGFDGCVFHLPCAAEHEGPAIESPLQRERRERESSRPLWGFTTSLTTLEALRRYADTPIRR